ncbi:conjugal transfer protein TraG N-terminal domain-containing protein [Qipengyuania profunda]|jgi:conjugal transfer mating pair stabilization protein TraG|uniref:conjugal transfer protein TraG N-terminal domain-containing protein n=1 Tax=Qipengyuania profunda TaxID=3113984 RepID=UPI002A18AA5E|nr:conjugal transfer protein TraG N-terminal domain-containing protein [Qipengyuania sp. HL-TH1]WPL55475.1 conjugal transfer protein TraG N-terminal domain-containing protein [Qipengyuania sp. HL-TH5]|tara:strand:+ start:8781 stop:11600 length:2820 start_codon:yes stop_codon:yes gene_type:complete
MMEIFTIGGGEYIVNVLNAVSAWTGGGGFRSLLRVVMVMGLIYSLLIVAFSLNWRAWLNWFLGATLMYGALIVPTTTVKVTDRLNPSLAPATVANVPVGLALIASVSSTAGDWLTRTSETVFTMPNALQMSNNGMIYGARLWDRTRDFSIRDPRISANLEEYFKQCLFYDILLGHESFDAIANSNDILTEMGPGSPARGMKWIPASGSPSIVTCQAGYNSLQSGIVTYTDTQLEEEGRKLFPGLTPAAARAKLIADLPVIANQFHGSSQTAQQIFHQRSLVSAFLEARANLGAADGDTFAMLRAEEQARNTYTSITQQAMTWVPLLNIVLTVVFYAMFPVIFPLFLVPRTGVTALKGYFTGFFYLAAWGPLYAVLHMFIMDRASDSLNATAPGGITMAGMAGIDAVNADTATIAGFLMMSIPFLAAGMARGAMAVSSQATSMLAPAQGAAEAAAVERTTGNYSYGNESYMNLSSFNRQSNQWNTAPSFTGGAAVMSTVNPNGTLTKTTADGSTVFDTSPGMSRLAFGSSLSSFNNAERQQTLSELETARNTLTEERSRAVSFLDRTSTRQTSGVRNASGSESSAGYRSGENTQRFDNQSMDARDGVSESERITRSQGDQQVNTDRLETTRGGNIGVGGSAGRGNTGGRPGRGSGAGLTGGAQAGMSGGRTRLDSVDRGSRRDETQGFDSSTSDNRSNGSNVTQDSGTYSQSGSFNRSEAYTDNSYSRERALEQIRRIDERIAAIDETALSLSNNTSTRDGVGANVSFDMSQIVASRYQEKAAEMGITAPSLARTDYSPQEQAAYDLVAREIISDYYDQRVAPYRDLIPQSGSVVGNVSGPGNFTEADLRGSTPRPSHGGPRNHVSGTSDNSVGDRIDEGGSSIGERYEANGQRYGQRRQEFEQGRDGLGGADDRFNERFYDRDERRRSPLQRRLRGDKE